MTSCVRFAAIGGNFSSVAVEPADRSRVGCAINMFLAQFCGFEKDSGFLLPAGHVLTGSAT